MSTLISHTPIWQALQTHQRTLTAVHLRDLFAQDPQRFVKYSLSACGLFLDFSKNHLTGETFNLLLDLARKVALESRIEQLFQGDNVNNTEQRAALHTALRNHSQYPILVDNKDVMPAVNAVLAKMRQFSETVNQGKWLGYTGKRIDTLVNIGIGGSDLGPLMVVRALKAFHIQPLRAYFVSNADSTQLAEILADCNPETTLFIVASKTFSTQETLLNAHSARRWLIEKLGTPMAVARHFVAVSTNTQLVQDFGIDTANMFEFWGWVGGRYSLWSAIGLSIAVMIGMDNFEQLLAGAHAMDRHFASAPLAENMPVILGLLGVWYSSFWSANTHVILPYDVALEHFPAYLQQLVMESLGKQVTKQGINVDYATCPISWGTLGNNGQHAFYQLLHQGTQLVPADFLVAIESQHSLGEHQFAVLSNALAQAHVLMQGRTVAETRETLQVTGLQAEALEAAIPHRVFKGNQPSNTLVYQKLTPQVLGALIALYEHKTFVQSVCWGINAFDQWGVELGKQMASTFLTELKNTKPSQGYNSSTDGLLNYIKTRLV
ncbi:glucose-6-phosphate isomerase [Beggiatoa leptomitoformis]|uniref:Glucose-6-phosphate isomerase n=1 Tax=Beggiatoa leptomitoformis TaxID=288004 RepID=A0A2N9YHU4_9GAMM|nr:glucose-6-phosphate isomerase [Beggiatoa leptomitoformis]ALG67796.1 glucose-6-phosphate isomerase [Beggiatoa leptomitoformis]AUI69955.1 glucose-6-phosphate isomerase [Beggiatoa leptomitoformis]